MGFLKTIAIIILVFYAIKFIGRLAAPFLVKKMADKMNEKFQGQQQKQEPTKPEGEVTVDKQPTKESKFSKNEGEYVDFEDIKD